MLYYTNAVINSCEAAAGGIGNENGRESNYSFPSTRSMFDYAKSLGNPECCVGNPIDVATGNKYQEEVDYAGNQLELRRYYNSNPPLISTALGKHWRQTFDRRLEFLNDGRNFLAYAHRQDGRRTTFRRSGAAWTSDPDVVDRLEFDGSLSRWKLHSAATMQTEYYSAEGLLLGIQSTNGNTVDLSYSDSDTPSQIAPFPGLLLKATNRSGRSLQFMYTFDGRLSKVIQPSGDFVQYGYDLLGNLIEAKYNDGRARKYHYNESVLNGGADQPGLLTGITGEDGARLSSYGYNSKGQAMLTQRGSGAEKYQVVQDTNGLVSVSSPTGSVDKYEFSVLHGMARVRSRESTCTGCAYLPLSRTYDAAGFPDVFREQGVISDYSYNSSGLEVQRMEGVGTASQRTIQRDWSEVFRTPIEQRTYRADGVLIAKTIWTRNARGQATTEVRIDPATGETRTARTLYCEQPDIGAGICPFVGLVISTDGPRTDVDDTATYQYHSDDHPSCATAPTTCHWRKGDLWKVTNAMGQVTESLRYDGAGRLVSSRESNGVIADFDYDERGRLIGRTTRASE